MADNDDSKGSSKDRQTNGEGSGEKSLEDFVTQHYQQQKENGKFDATEEIDDVRTENFFDRAIAESRRMNAETNKSKAKLDKLQAELGVERFAAWQAEHAAEVLLPEQAAAIGMTTGSS